MKVSFVQQILLHCFTKCSQTPHTKKLTHQVASITYPSSPIAPHSQVDWDNVKICLPPLCASITPMHHRSPLLIEVQYGLVFSFQPSFFAGPSEKHFGKDLVFIPLCIGTVPMIDCPFASFSIGLDNNPAITMNDNNGQNQQQQDGLTTISSAQTNYYPPPSYECANMGDDTYDILPEYDDIKGDIISSDARTFKPYYPYYGGLSR